MKGRIMETLLQLVTDIPASFFFNMFGRSLGCSSGQGTGMFGRNLDGGQIGEVNLYRQFIEVK